MQAKFGALRPAAAQNLHSHMLVPSFLFARHATADPFSQPTRVCRSNAYKESIQGWWCSGLALSDGRKRCVCDACTHLRAPFVCDVHVNEYQELEVSERGARFPPNLHLACVCLGVSCKRQ